MENTNLCQNNDGMENQNVANLPKETILLLLDVVTETCMVYTCRSPDRQLVINEML